MTTLLSCPKSQDEFRALIEKLASSHEGLRQQSLLFFLKREKGGESEVVASTVQEGKFGTLHLLFEVLGRPELGKAGYIERKLSDAEREALFGAFTPFHADAGAHPNVAFLSKAAAEKTPVSAGIVCQMNDALKANSEYLRYRTTLVFDLFNQGALKGIDGIARQALLDSFGSLPTRPLTSDGRFVLPSNEGEQLVRKCGAWTSSGSEAEVAGFDKFPSLMAVRGKQLLADGNRVVPSVMIRDGAYVGKRNIFMFHAAVNLAAYIGDDNLIDSHASIASAAQIGNRNKIGSFVSLEGVLSPANARPVVIGDDNFIGTFARIGTGITVGNSNFIGAGVNLSLGTKIKDCRKESATKGEYLTVEDINKDFQKLALMPNNAARKVEGVDVLPGEYLLMENTEDFMKRFEGDSRIKASK